MVSRKVSAVEVGHLPVEGEYGAIIQDPLCHTDRGSVKKWTTHSPDAQDLDLQTCRRIRV